MTAHAEAVLHGDGHEHHGPPAANQSSRIHPALLGMFLFIASEAMIFGSFFTAYFFIRVVNPGATVIEPERWSEWLPCKEPLVDGVCLAGFYEFPVFVAGINTAILLTSSFTMHWALQSIKRGERNGLKAGLVLTIAMGLAFLLTQMIEYAHIGFNTGDGAFASAFFGLTGLHGAHVFVGLTLLTVMAARAFKGHFTPDHHHGVELAGIYWHFVDIMWIIVYVTVYLI